MQVTAKRFKLVITDTVTKQQHVITSGSLSMDVENDVHYLGQGVHVDNGLASVNLRMSYPTMKTTTVKRKKNKKILASKRRKGKRKNGK